MVGTKLYKGFFSAEEYAGVAAWCNANRAVIEDRGEYYEVAAVPELPEEEKAAVRIAGLRQYLDSTDWYAVRFAETGVPVPDEVRRKRQAAREEIDSLRAVLTD